MSAYKSTDFDEESIRNLSTADPAVFAARDSNGQTLLHFAVKHGRVEPIKMLLEKGADPNVADNKGMTPLLCAVEESTASELVPLLIKHGANVFAKDHRDRNALLRLTRVFCANIDVAQNLIEMGVSLHYEGGPRGYQPIHWAVLWGNQPLVKLFLDYGANVNAQTKRNGIHPLYLAPFHQNLPVLKTLLDRGANTRLKGSRGRTALHIACLMGSREEHISELVAAGADLFAEDDDGKTPFAVIQLKKMENPSVRLIIEMLAAKRVLMGPSFEIKDERAMDAEMWDYYINRCADVAKTKFTRINRSCTLFQLLTQCPCTIETFFRNPEFEANFIQQDLSQFGRYEEAISQAFQRAKNHYNYMLELKDSLSDSVDYILPDLTLRQIVGYLCANCSVRNVQCLNIINK